MKPRIIIAFALAGLPAFGHRLDEYLQATLVSIESNRVRAEMTLTPGVAVFPHVIAAIDRDGDGVISEQEKRAYSEAVLADLSLTADGKQIAPRLNSSRFPTVADMKEGRGEIHLDFAADLPAGSGNRALNLENRHHPAISVYLVNSLVPNDSNIEISAQKRNYSQSQYEVDYTQTPALTASSPWTRRESLWLAAIIVLMGTSLVVRLRRYSLRTRASQGLAAGLGSRPPLVRPS